MLENIYFYLLLLTNLLINTIETNQQSNQINDQQPDFVRNIPNLSIVKGKDAYLRCSVSNLGDNKIIWTFVDSQQLLSIQEHVIENRNGRISMQVVGDTFELRISNVSLDDRGYYMCEINCSNQFCTGKSQVGFLNVVVPPKFDEDVLQSESNVTVREFEDVDILCSASTGNPKPILSWKREDVYLNEHHVRGNRLHIISANRQDAGTYICIANNGVQPSISRIFNLIVQFAPMIQIVTQVVPAYINDNVKLECHTESNPLAEHFWIGPNGQRISSSSTYNNSTNKKRHRNHNYQYNKYQIRLKQTTELKCIFQLQINYISYEDAGYYICQLSNAIGETRSSIQLKVNERSQQATRKVSRPTTVRTGNDLHGNLHDDLHGNLHDDLHDDLHHDLHHKLHTTFKPDKSDNKNRNRKIKIGDDNQLHNHLHPLSNTRTSKNQANQLLKNEKSSTFKLKSNLYLYVLLFVNPLIILNLKFLYN